MQRLWTPWRMKYVVGTNTKATDDIFVDALEHADEPDSLVLYRTEHCFLIMNLYPYNTGHMMAVPNEKVPSIEDLDAGTRAELFELVNLAVETARPVLRCDGFNIGLNIGNIAGAGVSDHLHIHIVPRWLGDANFMPITASTMVLPETIPATYARLRGQFESDRIRDQKGVEVTAGCITYLPESDEIVLRRTASGEIVLPKGHIEPGENAAEAAVREVHEETGFLAQITGWAGCDDYISDAGNRIHVVFFLAEGERTPDVEEHLETDTLLVPLDDAAGKLDVPNLADLVQRVTPLIQTTES